MTRSLVAYVASPLASATTGAAIRVDGGVIKSASRGKTHRGRARDRRYFGAFAAKNGHQPCGAILPFTILQPAGGVNCSQAAQL